MYTLFGKIVFLLRLYCAYFAFFVRFSGVIFVGAGCYILPYNTRLKWHNFSYFTYTNAFFYYTSPSFSQKNDTGV